MLEPRPTGRGSEPHPVGELQSSLGFWGTVKNGIQKFLNKVITNCSGSYKIQITNASTCQCLIETVAINKVIDVALIG